jgi:hypothetical protein
MDDDARRDVDPTRISLAGAYDFSAGGDDNTRTDRLAVLRFEEKWPGIASNAVANAKFLQRVVRYMAEQGIRQILDLGAGKPKSQPGSNVHEILTETTGHGRVVYVEKDPTAHAHARAIWGRQPGTGYVEADLSDVDHVLNAPETRRLIDFEQPVGLLMLASLHYILGDVQPAVARYADAVPAGSMMAISHMCSDGAPAELIADLQAVYEPAGGAAIRSRDTIEGLFCGWPLVEPGLVEARDWRPEESAEYGPIALVGGVARKA